MLRGCITDTDFSLVDEVFPGLLRYYRTLPVKPSTFLELLWQFMAEHQEAEPTPIPAPVLHHS